MRYLLVAALLLSGCKWTEKDTCQFHNGQAAMLGYPIQDCDNLHGEKIQGVEYIGGLTWSQDFELEKIKCEHGRLIYPRTNISTDFIKGIQEVDIEWQCIDKKSNTLHHLKANKTSLRGMQK